MKNSNLFLILLKLLSTFFLVEIVEGIIGGHEVNNDQFKFMVSIQASGKHICSGAIVGELHVLTAAQCVINKDNEFRKEIFTVVGGVLNLNTNGPHKMKMDVEKIYVPKEFQYINHTEQHRAYSSGNIALLLLSQPLNLYKTPSLGKLEYPRVSYIHTRYVNKKVNVSGFGIDTLAVRTSENIDTVNLCLDHCTKLKYAEVVVIDKKLCSQMLPESIRGRQLCAQIKTTKKEGVCDGDVGGPLILNGVIIGILVSPTVLCNEKHTPSIYTKVVPFSNFITLAEGDSNSPEVRVAYYTTLPDKPGRHLIEFFKFM